MEETTMQWLQSLCPTIQQSIKCICVGRQHTPKTYFSHSLLDNRGRWVLNIQKTMWLDAIATNTISKSSTLFISVTCFPQHTHTLIYIYIQTQTNQITHSTWFLTHSLSLSSVHFFCLFFSLLLWCHQTFLIRFVFLSLLCFQLLCQTHRRFKRNLFKWLKF